ncbi:DUF6233 domain-containing protein [Streptomyces griseus]
MPGKPVGGNGVFWCGRSAERARAELADGVQACGVCRPDRVLNRT